MLVVRLFPVRVGESDLGMRGKKRRPSELSKCDRVGLQAVKRLQSTADSVETTATAQAVVSLGALSDGLS